MAILIIDDNPFSAAHIQRMCAGANAWSEGGWPTAATAAEGLLLARDFRPSLILLDPTSHASDPALEGYCRELAAAVSPAPSSLLLLHNPLQQFDRLPGRLADCSKLAIDSLSKPFKLSDLDAKLEQLRQLAAPLPIAPMPNNSYSAQRFAWLSGTPDISEYAFLAADGAVLEWNGSSSDEAGHGALVYLLNLANLCGEELGSSPVGEVQTFGREGSAMAVLLGAGAVLNVLGSPRANLRAISMPA